MTRPPLSSHEAMPSEKSQTSSQGSSPRSDDLRSYYLWFSGAIIVLTGLALALALYALRLQSIQSGARLTSSFAQVVEEQTTRSLQGVEQRLYLVRSELKRLRDSKSLTEYSARNILKEHIKTTPFLSSMLVLSPEGRVVHESDEGNIGRVLSSREDVLNYLKLEHTGFNIALPLKGSTTGLWRIAATIPWYKDDGSYAGLIVAVIDQPYFEKLWGEVDLGANGTIQLFRRDGFLFIRSPHKDEVIATNFSARPLFREIIKKGPNGSFESTSVIDAVARTFTYRSLTAQPEFFILVGRSISTILEPWRKGASLAIAIWVVAVMIIALLCAFLDTLWREKRGVEIESQKMAERLAIATEGAGIAVFDWNRNKELMYLSPTFFSMLGQVSGQDRNEPIRDFENMHPDDRDSAVAKMRSIFNQGAAQSGYEGRWKHADGSYRWINSFGRVIERDTKGQATRIIGVRIDVTARRKAEEDRLQMLERITDGFIALDTSWRYTYVNRKAAHLLGRKPETLIGKHIWTEFPEGAGEGIRRAYEKAMLDQQSTQLEEYFPSYDRWFENIVYPSQDGLSIYFHDITDRKNTEQAAMVSARRLRDLIDGLGPTMFVGLATPKGILLEANQPALEAAGLTLDDVVGQPLEETYWLSGSDATRLQIRAAVERGARGEATRLDMQIRGKGDQAILIDFSMQPIFSETGEVTFLVPSGLVITEREQALADLRASEERYRLLVDMSPNAIAIYQEGRVVFANQACLNLFGASKPEQFIGLNFRHLVHEDHYLESREKLVCLLDGEREDFPLEDRYRRIDGTEFDVEVKAARFTYQGQSAIQVIALDISARKRAEKAQRESVIQLQALSRRVLEVQEGERRRIARELHDELGQSLTAIKINLVSRGRVKGEASHELDVENIRIIDDTVQQVRRLALGLRPSMLDDFGLVPALDWMVNQVNLRGEPVARFDAAPNLGRFSAEIETCCFRIVQEALTNIARYAKASQLQILLYRKNDQLILEVKDDGVGFDVGAMRARAKLGKSFGIMGMQERATLIGGQLDVESNLGKGCTIRLSIRPVTLMTP